MKLYADLAPEAKALKAFLADCVQFCHRLGSLQGDIGYAGQTRAMYYTYVKIY